MKKEFKRTSASQIKNFRSCKRKWFRESILGEKTPPSPGALKGQEIHKQVEDFLLHGVPVKDHLAGALIKMLPSTVVQENQVEYQFNFQPEGWKVPITGFIDVVFPEKIVDHKTTSSLNYALNERTAKIDPQVLIYCGAGLAGELPFEYQDQIRFDLNYVTTKGMTKTRVCSVTLEKDHVEQGLNDLGKTVNEQFIEAKKEGWQEVQGNYSSCDNFGGCPFKYDCQKLNKAPVKEVLQLSGNIDSFKAKLEQRKKLFESNKTDVEGSMYVNANPSDGVPDDVVFEIEPKRKRPPKYNGVSIKTLKKGELVQAIREKASLLSESQIHELNMVDYENTIEKNKKAINLEILTSIIELLEKPTAEKKTFDKTNKTEETREMNNDLFWNLAKTPVKEETKEPVQETKEPVQAELLTPQPAKKETLESQPVQETIEPVQPKKTFEHPPEDEESLGYPGEWNSTLLRFLLVDAHCNGAQEIEVCLRPLIEEVQTKYQQPISTIKYAEGWKELAGLIERRGWIHSGFTNIIRVDSNSPLWINCSHAIVPLAHKVIRGTR